MAASLNLQRLVGSAVRFDHLAEWTEATPEDRAAFDEYAREWTTHLGVIVPLFVLVCLLLWWPVDWLVGPDERFVQAFGFMRSVSVFVLVAIAAAFRFSAWVQRHVYFSATVAYAASMATVGYSLGRLGGPDLSWLADAYVAALPAAIMPLPLGPRIGATIVIVAALPAAYFLPFPENWAAPAALGQISFAGFAAALATLVGETLLRTVRRSFLQGRSVARARAELEALASSLSERVSEQTAELRGLASHLENVQEIERLRLSRDLHDELGQDLTAMRYTLQAGERQLERRPEAAAALVDQLTALLARTTRTVRSLVMGLRPRLLEDDGLVAAIEWVGERARESELEVTVTVAPGADAGLSPATSVALFRCVQEATTNVIKHSEAARVWITVSRDDDLVTARIADDGVGMDESRPTSGFGVLGMRERMRAVGGSLGLDRRDGGGTVVTAAVPVSALGAGGRR